MYRLLSKFLTLWVAISSCLVGKFMITSKGPSLFSIGVLLFGILPFLQRCPSFYGLLPRIVCSLLTKLFSWTRVFSVLCAQMRQSPIHICSFLAESLAEFGQTFMIGYLSTGKLFHYSALSIHSFVVEPPLACWANFDVWLWQLQYTAFGCLGTYCFLRILLYL